MKKLCLCILLTGLAVTVAANEPVIVPDRDPGILLQRMGVPSQPVHEFGRSSKIWSYNGSDNCSCIRAIADVNGDGVNDVVAGHDIFQSGDNLFCFSGASTGTGSVIWSLETTGGASGGYFWGDECLSPGSDADGNGYVNILAGLAGGGRFAAAYDGFDGTLLWQFDTYNEPDSGWVYSIRELGDVTGDGIPEVIFGCGSDNDHAYCIDGTSTGTTPTVVWSYSLPDASFSVCPIADVNSDGYPDALISSGDTNGHHVYCIEGDSSVSGNPLWTYDAFDSVHSVTAISDTNGNGAEDAVAGTWGSGVRCIDGLTGSENWFNLLGGTYIMMVRPLDDVTGDGIDEVLVGSWDNAVYCLDGSDGTTFWTTPTGSLNGGDVWTIHSISDVNYDGYDDVLAGSFDTYSYCMSGVDGAVLFQYLTDNRVYSVYPGGDLNADTVNDVLTGTQDTSNTTVIHAISGADDLPTPTPAVQQVLLIPESSNDTVGMYDPFNGTYLGDIITGYSGFSTPIDAVLGPDGNIYVSDQLADAVFVFDTDGTYLYTYADSSDGLNNIRGIDFYGNDLYITSGDDYVARFSAPHVRETDFINDGSDPFDIYFLDDGRALLADIQGTADNIRLYNADGTLAYEIFNVNFPEQIQKLPGGDYINAGFSAGLITTFDLTTTISQVPFSSGRGVFGLGNGNLLVTSGAGVFEIDPASGVTINTIRSGISARFIEEAALPMGATPTPTETPAPTETPTPNPTMTPTPTETPFATTTPPPLVPSTGSLGTLLVLIAFGLLIAVSVSRKQ